MRALPGSSVARALACALLAGAAAAQNERSLARDDLLFARGLAQGGYPDLASDFLDVYEAKHRTNRDEMLQVAALRLDLREDAAYREAEPRRRLELLMAVIREKEGFSDDSTRLPLVQDLVARLPDLYRNVGELTATILEDEPDAEDARELRAQSRKLFERALLDLRERADELGARRAEQDLDARNPELDRQYMLASYNLARTHYYHALVLDEQSDARRENVEQALAVFFDFQLDFADQLLCYEGFVYEGLCHALLDEDEKALESYDAAIRLRETYEMRSGVYAMPPAACDLVSAGAFQKVKALAARGDDDGALAAAEDFLATVPDALHAYKGVDILALAAECHARRGDAAAVEAAAKRLIEADPHGPGGERGRLILREAGATQIAASDTLRLAEAAAARGELERAIELAQEAARDADGTKNEQDTGARAGVLIGALHAQLGNLKEAAAAWDAAADRYAKGKDAPECLWRAINAYLALGAREGTPSHRDRARERMAELASRYREHPYASMAALIEGQELEQERRYVEAAALYDRIATQGDGNPEALYRAGQAWSRAAREAFVKRKQQDAPPLVAKAEERLTKAIPALEAAADATLDRTTEARLRSLSFAARVALANLFMLDGVARAADALPLFADSESRWARDETKLQVSRRVRMKALQLAGRVDEAVLILDACRRSDPTLAGMAAAAASLAQAIDASAAAVEHDDPLSPEVDRLRRRAAEYYGFAIGADPRSGASDGQDGAGAQATGGLEAREIELIADRLFALALHFNGVPPDSETFVDSPSRRPDLDSFERALRAYESLAARAPSARTEILIGRTLAFLGRWQDAAARYAKLLAADAFVDLESRSIDPDKLRARPELLPAALEWAVSERQAGAPRSDADALGRASAILEAIVLVARPASRTWWQSKHYQLRVLVDRGEYELAAIALRSLQRSYPEYDESEFGVRDKLRTLDEELARLGHK